MDAISKIKAEIERRMKKWDNLDKELLSINSEFGRDAPISRWCELADLLSFIESLEKEEVEDDYAATEKALKTTEDKLKELGKKIALARKSWKGVDADKYMDEVRGREPKIKGWVARGVDGLTVFAFYPKKDKECGYWYGYTIGVISDSFAPEMTREDEPIEVELTIHRV